MKELTSCASDEALVTYVYDECQPAERDAIAAHASQCLRCSEEIESLRDTRAHLGGWITPSAALGFRIPADDSEPARVLRPAAWWRQPLPAWAQMAAAAVIFAAGLGVGASRSAPVSQATVTTPVPDARAVVAPVAAVTADDFASLAARIRAMEVRQSERPNVQMAHRSATGPDNVQLAGGSAAVDDDALAARVRELVDERVTSMAQQQRNENVRVLSVVAPELEMNREARQRLSMLEEEVQQQRQAWRTLSGSPLVRVALQPSSPAAR